MSACCATPAARSRSTISAPAIPRLRHLQSLAVDTVKIDGSFIRNLSQSPESQVFLRHLLGLAKGFGFNTVAECVTTAEDAEILRREGVGLLQGYYFGKPLIERPWLRTPAPTVIAAVEKTRAAGEN